MKSLCYIADISGPGKIMVGSGELGQYVRSYYPGGKIKISGNRLYHIKSENENKICILRKRKIIYLHYSQRKQKKLGFKKLRCGDAVILMAKEPDNNIYIKYLAELFYISVKRRKDKHSYPTYEKLFEETCKGNIFLLIWCIGI